MNDDSQADEREEGNLTICMCGHTQAVIRDKGSSPAQGIKCFSPMKNVIQGLSVLGPFKLH